MAEESETDKSAIIKDPHEQSSHQLEVKLISPVIFWHTRQDRVKP